MQDVPVEASETLAFTPESLTGLDTPPVFTLRAVTTREKRFRARLMRENGIVSHSDEAVREESLAGLRALWTAEQFEEHSARLTDYWKQRDDFDLASDEDETLVWDFDPAAEQAIDDLLARLERSWPPLARMAADLAEYRSIDPLAYIAVAAKDWTGLDVPRELDRGYLTLDCAEALAGALFEKEQDAGAEPGAAFRELYIAALGRFYLDEETRKNSPARSPSSGSPEPSSTSPLPEAAGSSPTSAKSTKTPLVH
jgi:hypothetical protein